jgi:hypothetical protein
MRGTKAALFCRDGNAHQGAAKNKSATPVVGGFEAKKGPRVSCIFRFVLMAFLNSSHRETPENVIAKKSENKSIPGSGVLVFGRFFVTIMASRHHTPRLIWGIFCSAFELQASGNTRNKTKKEPGGTDGDVGTLSVDCLVYFRHGLVNLQKHLLGA